jgi:hypothetical protein
MRITLTFLAMLAIVAATAQVKKETKILTTPKAETKVVTKPKTDNKVDPKKKVGSIDVAMQPKADLPSALRYLNPIVNTVGGTKITTYIAPIDRLTTAKASDRNPKAKNRGTKEDNGLICTSYSISLSPESETFDAPLADKMSHTYPGAAYNYFDYIKNNTQPPHNKSKRNPIILQVSSSSGNGKQILVENPTKNNLDEATGKLKFSLPKQAGNLSTEIYVQSIVNEASFALNVEAGGGGYGFKASAKFGLQYDSKKSYMSIDAKQKNYVITANRPDDAEGGFYLDSLENTKNDNVYMSSVTYGRRVIGVIETELDQDHMEVGAKVLVFLPISAWEFWIR